jgi:ribosome biogenesis protein MAK21
MIGRMMKEKPGLKTMINFIANDEEETFADVPEEEDSEAVTSSSKEPQKTFESKYDPRKRDPSFANADSTHLWELMPFVNHFHPTVSLYARSLLKDAQIEMPANASNYDPLTNHTLSKFLDRFVYKNPKKMQNEYKGSSLMQPRIQQSQEQPLNLLDWSKKNEMNVPVEEVSFIL